MEAVRELAHTADVGFEVRAPSVARLFELAARGLFEALGASPADVPGGERTMRLERPDMERLLVAWLRELLEVAQSLEAVAMSARVEMTGDTALRAVVDWRPWTADGPTREIKGITYHGLRLAEEADGSWHARVVLDV